MTEDKTSGGNISLVKNAARDKNGKRKGNFSQVDHSINALADKIGLDGYGIYPFLLNNAGGNFWYSSTALSSIFKNDNLSKSRIDRAINALIANGLLKREKIGQKGKRPLYGYCIYEISTKQQPVTACITDTTKQELSEIPQQLMPSPPQIDLSIPAIDTIKDFSVNEIQQAIQNTDIIPAENIPAPVPQQSTSPPKTKSAPSKALVSNIFKTTAAQQSNDFKQHIFDICQREGAFKSIDKDNVLKCCRRYYAEHNSKPNDNVIALFANYFSADSTQNPMTVYDQVVVM